MEPGFINSNAFQTVRFTPLSQQGLTRATDPYHAHYIHMKAFFERMMHLAVATPDSVAGNILKTIKMRRPPLRVAGTIDALLFSLMRRLLPQRLYYALLYRGLPKVNQWGQE